MIGQIASLVTAIVSFGWLLLVGYIVYVVRPDLSGFVRRLRRGKLFGQEFELSDDLRKLEASATTASIEAAQLEPTASPSSSSDADEVDATIRTILRSAATSSKAALMALWLELEKRLRQALALRGRLNEERLTSFDAGFSEMQRYGLLANLAGSLRLFRETRNKIVHGIGTSDDDALSALDSGITILRALAALPVETNIVSHPGVPIFSDASCDLPITDAVGVVLETTSPGGVKTTYRIFPTTRKHFKRGHQVAWEWDMRRTWPKTWYRDPGSGEIKEAWDSSAEFVGRHLDDI
jgi:hypothetical protein